MKKSYEELVLKLNENREKFQEILSLFYSGIYCAVGQLDNNVFSEHHKKLINITAPLFKGIKRSNKNYYFGLFKGYEREGGNHYYGHNLSLAYLISLFVDEKDKRDKAIGKALVHDLKEMPLNNKLSKYMGKRNLFLPDYKDEIDSVILLDGIDYDYFYKKNLKHNLLWIKKVADIRLIEKHGTTNHAVVYVLDKIDGLFDLDHLEPHPKKWKQEEGYARIDFIIDVLYEKLGHFKETFNSLLIEFNNKNNLRNNYINEEKKKYPELQIANEKLINDNIEKYLIKSEYKK